QAVSERAIGHDEHRSVVAGSGDAGEFSAASPAHKLRSFAAVSCLSMSPSTRTSLADAVDDGVARSEVATTLKPALRNRWTNPAPIPSCAPVTIAVFSLGM